MIIFIEILIILVSAAVAMAVPPALFELFNWNLSKSLGLSFSLMYLVFAHSYYFTRILIKRPVSELSLKWLEFINVALTIYMLLMSGFAENFSLPFQLILAYWPFLFIAWFFNRKVFKESVIGAKRARTKMLVSVIFFLIILGLLGYKTFFEKLADFGLSERIASYTEKIEENPNTTKFLINRASLYEKIQEFELALQDYNTALNIEPKNPMLYFHRGWFYFSVQRNYDLAITDMTTVIELAPEFDESYDVRGLAYAIKGEKQKALRDFEKLLKITDDPVKQQQVQQQILELSENSNSE